MPVHLPASFMHLQPTLIVPCPVDVGLSVFRSVMDFITRATSSKAIRVTRVIAPIARKFAQVGPAGTVEVPLVALQEVLVEVPQEAILEALQALVRADTTTVKVLLQSLKLEVLLELPLKILMIMEEVTLATILISASISAIGPSTLLGARAWSGRL